MKLSKAAFQKAREYIKNNAEEVESALFEYYFEGASSDGVINALKEYQNEDGGFNNLEYDFTTKASSTMSTTIAFQYLRKINASSKNEIVQKGIQYFINTYDENKRLWHAVPTEVNNEPHAPWWHYDEKTGGCMVEHCFANPSAEIIGYLNEYSDLVSEGLLNSLNELALKNLFSRPDKLEMHEMLCYLRMSDKLSPENKQIVIEKLRKSVRSTVELDPTNWDGYSAKTLIIADSPQSLLIDPIKEEVKLNLDYEIGRQTSESFWEPNWSWGQYEEVWEIAKKKWAGRLTLDMLIKLKKFGRIEE